MKVDDYYNLDNLRRTSEKLVLERLGRALDERQDICQCEECVLDLVAYMLNHVTPFYGTSLVGSLDPTESRTKRIKGEIEVALRQGLQKVSRNPNHGK